jgi:hypothetical protein
MPKCIAPSLSIDTVARIAANLYLNSITGGIQVKFNFLLYDQMNNFMITLGQRRVYDRKGLYEEYNRLGKLLYSI